MIPLKLHIKNFLSYGSPTQTIDFSPYHLICLSGKNGHGKSALLDALTWAVWGQARKGVAAGKADEGLLRLGQTHMAVALDFMCNGSTYRVRREFTYERNKGVTQLDFGVVDETLQLRELTDKTIRATQSAIDRTIGFDYESFINSVFLRQGNSNEFSKKSPKERKEVLASILGLTHYERLRKQAAEKAREGTIHLTHLNKHVEVLKTDIAHKQLYQDQLMQLSAQTLLLQEQEQQCTLQLQQLAGEKKTAQERLQTKKQLLFMQEQLHKNLTLQQQQLRGFVQEWRTINKKLHSQNALYDASKKVTIEIELAQLQEKASKRLALTQEIMAFSTELQNIKTYVQQQHHEQQQQHLKQYHTLESQITALQTELMATTTAHQEIVEQQTHLTTQLETLTKDQQVGEQQKRELAHLEAQFERRKQFYQTWAQRGNKIAQELKKLTAQRTTLQTSAAQCPLCKQNLLAQHKNTVEQQLHREQRRLQHQLHRLTRCIPQLKELLTQQHKQRESLQHMIAHAVQQAAVATSIEQQQQQLAHMRMQKEQLLAKHTEILQQHTKAFESARAQKAIFMIPLDGLLLGNAEYRALQQKIKKHEQALTQYHYDQQQYDALKQTLHELIVAHNEHQELAQQKLVQSERKQKVHELCRSIRALKQEDATLQTALIAYANLDALLLRQEAAEQKLLVEKQYISTQKEQIAHQRGAVEQMCARITQQEVALQAAQTEERVLEEDTSEYQILAQALSKDGIQGLLIEHCIPEIEMEANNLLAKLTNNQAQLMLESTRDLKSGGIKETLEIKIADAIGVRPYELFSGGEAFRIDFALRLAVSKLLARRSGTSLQTLIIDEGFGSQDEEGLHLIMECLYAIQEDFAKIIIVSHLPSMKDQFPVHFYVQKHPRGSTVQIIEQG